MRPPLPREHGAWGMLILPWPVALSLAGAVGPAAVVALIMVLAVYCARAPLEPWLRGRREPGELAWLAGEVLVAVGAAGLLLGWQRTTWLWIPVALLPAGLLSLGYARRRQSRDVVNEMLGAICLPAGGAVVLLAENPTAVRPAVALWLLFALYNALALPYVRAWVMAGRAEKNNRFALARDKARRAAYVALPLTLALVLALAATGLWPRTAVLAFLPGAARIVRGLPRLGRVDQPIARLGWREMAHATLFATLVGVVLTRA